MIDLFGVGVGGRWAGVAWVVWKSSFFEGGSLCAGRVACVCDVAVKFIASQPATVKTPRAITRTKLRSATARYMYRSNYLVR